MQPSQIEWAFCIHEVVNCWTAGTFLVQNTMWWRTGSWDGNILCFGNRMVAHWAVRWEHHGFCRAYGCTPDRKMGTWQPWAMPWLQVLHRDGNIIALRITMVAGFCLMVQPWEANQTGCSRIFRSYATKRWNINGMFPYLSQLCYHGVKRRPYVRRKAIAAPASSKI